VVCQATKEVAARGIVGKTHRLATEREIDSHLEREAEKRRAAVARSLRDMGIVTMTLPPAQKARR
jgi:hypothetical protein